MKNFVAFAVQQKILLAILGVGIATLSFLVWKYQNEQYQKLLANQKVLCEKSITDAYDSINKSEALSSAYDSENFSDNETPRNKIRHPGINTSLQNDRPYVLIRSNKTALIPANTPHYKSNYFEGYSKPPGGETIFAAIVTAEPLNDKEALVKSPCSPKPFATPFKDLYETLQQNDFTSDSNLFKR